MSSQTDRSVLPAHGIRIREAGHGGGAALVVALLVACIMTESCDAATIRSVDRGPMSWEALCAGFEQPPAETRPFLRWWSNNKQVGKDERIRKRDLLRDAGIGRGEINPSLEPTMSRDGVQLSKAKVLPWRSPEWDEIVRFTAEAAAERGMITGLIGGSSWPFGGEFLEPHHQVHRLSIFRKFAGTATYRATLAVAEAVCLGTNTLEIEYAMPLYNAVRDRSLMQRWWKKFNRDARPNQFLGLLGPVTLSHAHPSGSVQTSSRPSS
ncbi:MAG: hypothetical protein AAGJ38_02475 [Planctomycetota bacterium]